MKTARLHALHDVQLHDEPDPEPGPGESLLRVTAVGLCGSDIHWYTEGGIGGSGFDDPIVLGHEFAGVVEGGPLDGLAVIADPAIPCGQCETCARGWHNLCPNVVFAGYTGCDGALRERMTWPTSRLTPVPESFTPAATAMLEPFGVALHAVDLSHLRAASSVAVVGCGPIGLFVVQLVRALGAGLVTAVDPLAHRRDAAVAMGADAAVEPGHAGEAAPALGYDLVIEAAGTDDAVWESVRVAAPGAKVVLVGIPGSEATSFPASPARRKGLQLVMSRRMLDMYPRSIRLAERGLVDLAAVVSHTFPLARAGEAFNAAAKRTGLKVCVLPA